MFCCLTDELSISVSCHWLTASDLRWGYFVAKQISCSDNQDGRCLLANYQDKD